MLVIPGSFAHPYEEAFWDSWGTWISRDAHALRQEVHSEGDETLKKMTELIVEMTTAKLGRTDTEEKATFEYNRHYHTQLSALLALLQPFADARQRTPEELEALVTQHREDQHVQGPVWRDLHAKFNEFRVGVEREILAYCDAFYLDTLEVMGPWVAHHMRDWF